MNAADTDEPAGPRVLCVDDEPRVLEGLERTLGLRFDVSTACGGAAALDLIRDQPPFAVIMSDMRMPQMSGATFLSRARTLSPDSVRVLLTGQADLDAAMSAVNEGAIFRFLTKPCPTDQLAAAVDEAVRQHQLRMAERELLQQTLTGTISLLTEVLAITHPEAFAKAQRTKAVMQHLTEQLMLDDPWMYEAAALFAPLGLITLPPGVFERATAGSRASPADRQLYARAATTTYRLLAAIPRLGPVAEIIREHTEPSRGAPHTPVAYGAAMLRMAHAWVPLVDQHGVAGAATRVAHLLDGWDRDNVGLLEGLDAGLPTTPPRSIRATELQAGQRLLEDLCARTGLVLAPKGQTLSALHVERIRQFVERGGVREPILVQG